MTDIQMTMSRDKLEMEDLVAKMKHITDEEAVILLKIYKRVCEEAEGVDEKSKEKEKVLRKKEHLRLAEAVALEKTLTKMDSLRSEIKGIQIESYVDLYERDVLLQLKIQELEKTFKELTQQEQQDIEEGQRHPELVAAEVECARLEKICLKIREALDRELHKKQALNLHYIHLKEEDKECLDQFAEKQNDLKKIFKEPERYHKQIESILKAAEKVKKETHVLNEKDTKLLECIASKSSKNQDADQVRLSLLAKLKVHATTLSQREKDLNFIVMNIDIEKARAHSLKLNKIEADVNAKQLQTKVRQIHNALSLAKNASKHLRQTLYKKIEAKNSKYEKLQLQKNTYADLKRKYTLTHQKNNDLNTKINHLRRSIDLTIATLLNVDGIEAALQEDLKKILIEVADLGDQQAQWCAEHARQNKLIQVLLAQRQLKLAEIARIQNNTANNDNMLIKEFLVKDTVHSYNDMKNRLKEFSALYDVVKNERNKYQSLIQSSSQALAEMREKLHIVYTELDIFKHEVSAKEKALNKETSRHAASQLHQHSLRLELHSAQSEYRSKQQIIEQQLKEIEKLNFLVNAFERKMLSFRTKFTRVVQTRNEIGASLIDRNDELCLLYEKLSHQQQTLSDGESAIQFRQREFRMIKLNLASTERELFVSDKNLQESQLLATRAQEIRSALEEECRTTKILCLELESPLNTTRWTLASGEDPAPDVLELKVASLNARIQTQKEHLLEHELVFDEVYSITCKLQHISDSQKDETLSLINAVSNTWSSYRNTTKSVHAAIAELSMYKATKLKLASQETEIAQQVDRAKQLAAASSHPQVLEVQDDLDQESNLSTAAPSQNAFIRLQDQIRALSTSVAKAPTSPTSPLKRPTAYLPHPLAAPKPYSNKLAPFKPSTASANMRYYRPPTQNQNFVLV